MRKWQAAVADTFRLISSSTQNCRHDRGIVHGGLSAMIIDEALGVLVYMLKRDSVLGPGPAFTAHLGVDYKKVWPCAVVAPISPAVSCR